MSGANDPAEPGPKPLDPPEPTHAAVPPPPPPAPEVCPICGSSVATNEMRCPSCGMSLAGVGGRPGPFSRRDVFLWAGGLVLIYVVALLVVILAG